MSTTNSKQQPDPILITKDGVELGILHEGGFDFPWCFGKFTPFDGFSEIKPMFDALTNKRKEVDLLSKAYEANELQIDLLDSEIDNLEFELDKFEFKTLLKSRNIIHDITTINISDGKYEYK